MDDIVLSVQRVTAIMGSISKASSEQEAGIGQINGAIIDLDAATQRSAALVEEAAASAEAMHVQAACLAKLVSHFQLADGRALTVPASSAGRPKRGLQRGVGGGAGMDRIGANVS